MTASLNLQSASSPRPSWAVAILVVLTIAGYLGVARCGFLTFDDPDYVTQNPYVKQGLTPGAVKWAFTNFHSSNWHPLTWCSHMLDVTLFGLKPAGHHLHNLLLHVANVVLVFLLLFRLTRARGKAFLVAALFAVHPLHVESVAWVAERKDVLSTFFGLLCLLAYTRHAQQSILHPPSSPLTFLRSPAYWLTFVLLACGLMSKPMLVTWPFVMLLLDWWPLNRLKPSPFTLHPSTLKWLLVEKLPLFALAAVSCYITFRVQSLGRSVAKIEYFSLETRFGNALSAFLDYLTRTFVPTKLAVFYPYPIEIPWAKAAGAAILLLLVFALAVRQLQQRPWLFVGWSWFVGTLVPVIGLVQVGMQASADRYTYIPHFGLLICIVWGAFELLPLLRISPQTVATTFGLAIAGALFLTTQQVRLWQNDELLFGHAKDVTERNYVAMTIYGRQLADRGRHEDALAYYQKVLEMQPRYAGGYYVIGDVYRDAGRTNDALASYSEAIRLDPFHAEALNSRGALLTHLGRPEEAVADFVKAIEAVPVFDVPRLNLGVVLKEQGKLSEAAEVFEAYLKVNPNSAKALALLGDIEFRQNHFPQSQKHYQQALRLEPGNFAAGYGLGCVYVATRRFQEAEAALLKVISIEKRRPEAYFQLGVAQTALGKADEAVSSLWHAVEMLPSSALYRYHLAAALQAAGRKSEALNAYEETLRLKRDFPEPLNNLAWILAADPDPAIRNGPRAVELAERACDLTQHREALLIGTLAAAYAEAGRFPDAIATAQKAIDLATAAGQPAIATRNRELLELYRAGQPYHEPTQ